MPGPVAVATVAIDFPLRMAISVIASSPSTTRITRRRHDLTKRRRSSRASSSERTVQNNHFIVERRRDRDPDEIWHKQAAGQNGPPAKNTISARIDAHRNTTSTIA